MVNVQKRLKGASVEPDFWHGENLDHPEKKALNSYFHLGPLVSNRKFLGWSSVKVKVQFLFGRFLRGSYLLSQSNGLLSF